MHIERSNNDVILSHKTRLARQRSSLAPHDESLATRLGVSIAILIVLVSWPGYSTV